MRGMMNRLTFKGYSVFISTFLILLFTPLIAHGELKTPLVITVSNQRTGEPMEKVEFRVFNENGEPIDGGESGKDGIVGTLDVPEGSSGTVFISKKGFKPLVVEYGPGKYENKVSLALQPLSFVRLSKSKLQAGTTPTKVNIPEFLTLPRDKINKTDPFFEPIKNLGGFPPGLEIDFVNIFPFGGFTTGQNQYQFHQVDIHYDKELPGDIDMDTVDTPEPAELFLAFAPDVIRDKEPEDRPSPKIPDDSIEKKESHWANLDVEIFGYLKLDAAYDDSRTTPGNYVATVDSETDPLPSGPKEFLLSAGPTTLHTNVPVTPPTSRDPEKPATPESEKPATPDLETSLRSRYLIWSRPDADFSLLAGQTSDSVGPLNPVTSKYTVLWWADWTERNIPLKGQSAGISYPDDPLYRSRGSWDQDYDDQWGLKRIGFTSKDQKSSAWNAVPGAGEPIVVAVIDSGCDLTHPELDGVIWRNEDEIADNGKDDDKNGFVDDMNG